MIRGKKIYLDYYIEGKRYKKSTGLNNTAENRRTVKKILIPQLLTKIETGQIYKIPRKTFKYYGEIFLQEKSEVLKAYETRKAYFLKVIDYFGHREISKITRLDIKRFYSSLKMKSTSKGAYRSCINGIFELAMDDEAINYNPALNISLGKQNDKKFNTLQKMK